MNPKSKCLVLFDAHAILHRAYHALPEFSNSKGEPTGALYGLSAMLIKIIGELKPDYMAAAYDLPKPTYRHEAYKEYKAGRKKAEEDLISQIIRSREIFKAFNIPMYDMAGFEADDILGTIVEQLKDEPIDIIIASGDMDTLQLVDDKKVCVYTLKKGISDTILYDEDKVIERFGFKPELLPDFKGLRGDPSDNIIGVAGIGEKTATLLIQNFGSVEDIYKKLKKNKNQFLEAGIKERMVELLLKSEEEAIFSKTLALIRRDAPIVFTLPEKDWNETINLEEANRFFGDLEFRTLGARFKEMLAKSGYSVKEKEKEEDAIPERELTEASTMLWLINSSITNPKLEDILNFAKTNSFVEAKRFIASEMQKRNQTRVWEMIEKPLIPVVRKMNARGVGIDVSYLKKLGAEYHKELDIFEKKIWKLAGEEFNINSPKQLGKILFEKLGLKAKNQKKTAGGALSTRESELEKLRESHEIIGIILDYRELQKLLSTYIDTIPALVDKGGRLHASFLQAGTTTGRMGCENPNLQNIPKKSDLGLRIRNAFVADKGFSLLAFDYSQIELRIAAFLSGDEKLIEIFKRGEDVHTSVASEVFKVRKEDVTKEMRRRAKVINFGIIYGMGVNALRANLSTTREEAQKFYNDYFETFSGLAAYLNRVREEAGRIGFTETYFGRRRYVEGITSKIPYIRAQAERMAMNAPIQGTEADIIKLAMVRADEYLRDNKLENDALLLLQVHDELVYEVRTEKTKEIAAEVKKIMENVIPLSDTSGVVCAAEVSVGKNWGEMKKVIVWE